MCFDKLLALLASSLLLVGAASTTDETYVELPEAQPKDTVHLVFSNHLDIGFDGISPELGYDNVVINKYFQWYFPLAMRMGEWFDGHDGPESHVYTAHSYLLSLYMNCPAGMGLECPSAQDQDSMRASVQKGHITWTALPWNGQLELMDPFTLASAAHVTFYLDGDMQVPQKTVISQRDVPGMTRAAIPVLVAEGIRAISVGVNSGSAPPDVPLNKPFVWKDAASGAKVMAFWHPYGYGGHSLDPASHNKTKWQLTPAEDCVKTPRSEDGSRDILCFSWMGDNAGPMHDPDQVLHTFELARLQFPGAKVIASTFEAFVDKLEPWQDELFEVTSEIGDTWIQGVASDPEKTAQYKAIMRMRSKCLLEESCTAQDPAFRNFTRLLLKVPEHTWGIDTKEAPASWDVWSADDFEAALESNALFEIAEKAWVRQQSYILWGMQALANGAHLAHTALADRMAAALRSQSTDHPAVSDSMLHAASPARPAACSAKPTSRPQLQDTEPVLTHPARALRAAEHSAAASIAVSELQAAGASQLGGERALSDSAAALDAQHTLLRGAVTRDAAGGGSEDRVAANADDAPSNAPSSGVGCGGFKMDTPEWTVVVDGYTGKLTTVCRKWRNDDGDLACGTNWAASGVFGNILYSTYSEADIGGWMGTYNPNGPEAADSFWKYDFAKPGSDSAGVGSQDTEPRFLSANATTGPAPGEQILVIHFEYVGAILREAGPPQRVIILLRTWPGSQHVMMDVHWKSKTATRLPEAMWVQFQPDVDLVDSTSMQLWKVGSLVSPLDVVRNGSHNLHALGDGGVQLTSAVNSWETLQVVSLDAPLVAIGKPVPLPDIVGPADVTGGFNYCLTNNIWGTNYVMWVPYQGHGRNMKFRFVITVRDSRFPRDAHWHLRFDPHFADLADEHLGL